ncbi:MAG: hypothetical protein J6L60_05660 [Bacteroidaceae bacterium]|nr:hypothetical protein [Bacteroidaceae bacterium]
MSRHHKRLTLDALNDTWDEIGKQSRKLEEKITKARTDAINTAIKTAKTEIDRAKAETNRRLDKEINDLERRTNRHLADLERRHNENLQRATEAIYDDMKRGFENMSRAIEAESEYLNGRIDSLQDWTQRNLDIIDKNIRQMQQDTNRRFEQQQQQIDSLQDCVQDIFDRFKNESTMARDVINDMTNLLKVVCDNNPVHIYSPGELHEIRSHINDLMTRCGTDPAASIIAESRGIIRDILKMKEKALLEKAKHDEMLFQTRARLTAILEIIGKNLNQEIERDGDTATIATDFWTDDEYSKVQNRLKAIERQLANEEQKDQLAFEQIADLLKEIEHLNLEGVALMQKAVRKAIQSQDRAEITLDIVNAMIRQGYEIKVENGNDDFDYMGGQIESDQREGVFAILRHPNTGEEITVVLQPNPDEKSNDIAIHVDNPYQAITEQQLRQSIERIRQEMRRSGYDPGPITTPANGGNEVIPQMQSGQQMRKRGAANQLRGSL